MKLTLTCIVAASALCACSASDMAFFSETGTYPDQTLASQYADCPTGQIVFERGISGGQSYDRAINRTQQRIMVNYASRFGGGNQFYANPGVATEVLWRSPVDASGAGYTFQCVADQ